MGYHEISALFSSKNSYIISGNEKIPYFFEEIIHPTNKEWNDKRLKIVIKLNAKELKKITINISEDLIKERITNPFSEKALDLSQDVFNENNNINRLIKYDVDTNSLSSPYHDIFFNEQGIKQIFSKKIGKNILEENSNLFEPMYIVENILSKGLVDKDLLFTQRKNCGKNKFSKKSSFSLGKFIYKDISISSDFINAKIKMYYLLESVPFYEIVISLNAFCETLEVSINLNKDTEWSMESLLIKLPFSGNRKFDYDSLHSPNNDQLLGTVTDYHSIQEGILFNDETFVSQLDSSLLYCGSMNYGVRKLHDKIYAKNDLYTWALNNVWETNFSADASGFHCFRYKISNIKNIRNKEEYLLALSSDLVVKRL